MNKPIVALVGRPNVGKSTLFNRLTGERKAIVDDIPGTTRDRMMSEAEWSGRPFYVIDTGGIDPSVGGKTPLSIGSADFIEEIKAQADIAIEDADTILFVVDAIAGITPADQEVAEILRRKQKNINGALVPPILLVVNKADSKVFREAAYQFYELGMGDPFPVSSLHGTQTGDLLDALVATFPEDLEPEEDESVKIALVGKPNVGKSSLLNRLVGHERMIVSDIPGTTRDAIDSHIDIDGLPVTLIDTAGIRKRGKVESGVEKYSVLRSMRAIERADVSLLLIDAIEGITAQDAHIAGYVLEARKSCVVVVNKWDAIEKDTHTMVAFTEQIRQDLNFMDYVPLLFISAKTGQRVEQVMPMALKVQEERLARLTTSSLNRILQHVQDMHTPSRAGRVFKMYYGTQVRSDPPTFLIYCNEPKLAHFTFVRFIENTIRKEYPFTGTPIHIVFKKRS
ncbi:MAG: ribosome biogenesis GTPase Der [Anaerolineaceae bacterium]|jgi:GTP-binding protein|nr:ribosome biogenesis GTPase Der [Anaerolineaceae bacterium]